MMHLPLRISFVLLVLLVLLASCGITNAQISSQVEFTYSMEADLINQEKVMTYFMPKYYNEDNKWSLNEADLQDIVTFGKRALDEPALMLGAAQALYLYAWFQRNGEIIRENIVSASQLFDKSIAAKGCTPEIPTDAWVGSACDIRYGQAMLLYQWLGDTDEDALQSSLFRNRAYELLDEMKQAPRFAGVKSLWTSPLHMNFNQLRFPNAPSRPFWDPSKVPLAMFLQENHHILKAELEAIINHPDDLYEQLRRADGSVESLSTPGGWDAIRIVRYGHWFDLFCEAAPQTCELLKTRPELVNCPYVNTNYYKLYPGSHLKPHFGNAPRLTVHIAVIAPEPLRSGITVGTEHRLWIEGHASVLDDTFPHAVSHWGKLPRYVLASWFCHPCDDQHDHKQICPEAI